MLDGSMSVMPGVTGEPQLTRTARELRMSEELKEIWLRNFLRLVSIGYLSAFIPWITLILLNASIMAPGGRFAPMLRFQPYNADYESMLTAISLVWAVMLWRASYEPAGHALFIDFTIWASAAHGVVMLVATPVQKGIPMTFVEAVPLFILAAVLWWLRAGTSRRKSPGSLVNGARHRTRRASFWTSPMHHLPPRGAIHSGRRSPRASLQTFISISP